jgi:hypothetical protein
MSFFGPRDITIPAIGKPIIAIERDVTCNCPPPPEAPGANVVKFTEPTPAKRAGAIHPVFTQADISHMSPHELNYFTDTPIAHVVAFRDFERDLMLERRRRDSLNALIARGAADRRQMGRW